MATIADVALEAGVARSTVSAVLTGRKQVAPETRQRIEDAIASLNFSVNSGARALATSRTMVLGLVVQLHGPEFTPALAPWVFALSDAARSSGYEVLLMTESDSRDAIRRVSMSRQVDGLVVLSIVEDDVRLSVLNELDVPTVLLGLPADTRGVDAVDLDFAAAARMLLEHLHEHGHREVLFAQRSEAMFQARFSFVLRFTEAANARARELGMALRPFHCPERPEHLPTALVRELRDRGRATALLVHDDAASVLLPLALGTAGLRVPEDISVVSLHSSELSRSLALPYTFVESDAPRISKAALAMLLRRVGAGKAGNDLPVVHELVLPRLTDRGSVASSTASNG